MRRRAGMLARACRIDRGSAMLVEPGPVRATRVRPLWKPSMSRRARPSPSSPPPATSGWGALAAQFALVAGCGLLYFGVRGMTVGRPERAIAHGEELLRLEHRLGIAIEARMQGWILDHRLLVELVNWIYLWGHWPVIVAVLVYLFQRQRAHYDLLRNAMIVSGGIGLVIFAAFPVAPPRLLDGSFVDTIDELAPSGRFRAPGFVNEYAAMPSLHVGWNLLVGVVLLMVVTSLPARVFAVASPVAMVLAVVFTANHYVVDAVAGVVVALVGLLVALRWHPRARAVPSRAVAAAGEGGEGGEEFEVVDDQAVDAAPDEERRVLEVTDGPAEEGGDPAPERPAQLRGHQACVDGHRVDTPG